MDLPVSGTASHSEGKYQSVGLNLCALYQSGTCSKLKLIRTSLSVSMPSCITRDRGASVGCGGWLNGHGVAAARQHLGIPARRSDRASFERTPLEHGEVSSWSCCRVATQPCWRRFYFVVPLSTTCIQYSQFVLSIFCAKHYSSGNFS